MLDSLGFLSEILRLSCTIFLLRLLPFKKKTEQSKWRVQGRERDREEGRNRGRRKRIIVEAGDEGVNSREIGGWEENVK